MASGGICLHARERMPEFPSVEYRLDTEDDFSNLVAKGPKDLLRELRSKGHPWDQSGGVKLRGHTLLVLFTKTRDAAQAISKRGGEIRELVSPHLSHSC